MTYFNNLGQGRIGWRSPSGGVTPSSLWTSVYAVYNADAVGSSSLKTSLVSAYNGESNTNDSFGSNNGTAQGGLTYTTGKIGDAFNFNGTTSYVGIPNTTDHLNFTGDFSISTWVMPLVTSAAFNIYFSNYKSGASGNGYLLYLNRTANKLVFNIHASTSYSEYGVSWTPLVNTWYHLTVSRKASTGTKLYINGVEVLGSYSIGNAGLNPTYQSGQIYNIGSSLNGSNLGNYRQDAVNVWNKELTQSEITELYNSGNGAQYITDSFYKPTTNDALNTYNGTAQGGLTYGVGKVGTAFQFNGTTAYVQLGDVMDIGLNSWSYSMWFNTAVSTTEQILFSKSLAAGLTGRFSASLQNDKVKFFLETTGGVAFIETVNSISINTWYNVVFVVDRSNRLQIYLNGTLQSVNRTGILDLPPYSAINFNTNCPFRIGAYTASNNTTALPTFNGSIDAFNAWNRVLTQTEITELYNAGAGKQYPN